MNLGLVQMSMEKEISDNLNKSLKLHIAQNVKFYEQDYYTPSDDGFKVFNTPFGNAKSGFYCNV